MKRGDEITLTPDNLSGSGTAVARHEGMVCFLSGAVPGDVVRARIHRVRKNHIEGGALEILTPSPHRVPHRCEHFSVCGGCRWQDLAYEAQLEFKRRRVEDVFRRIGGIDGIEVLPVKGCAMPYHYRNKMEYTFSNHRWLPPAEFERDPDSGRVLTLGLHLPERFDKILHLRECHLQSETGERILLETGRWFQGRGLDAYSTKTHTGYLRHLVVREGKGTGQVMVNLVTSDSRPEEMEAYTEFLLGRFPGITTVVNNMTARKSMVAQGESERVYHGDGTIVETIGQWKFRISANSFFQTNTLQAGVLFETVREMASFSPADTVYDLYCGTGAIAICLSDAVDRVIGVESNESAVRDAQRNALDNRVPNCYFVRGDLPGDLDPSSEMLADHPAPAAVVVDPPRSGLHEKLIGKILRIAPGKVVYVSCNAATQARDVKLFAEGGYRPGPVRPVDMFPHTDHIETVTVLGR